jgi:lipopolysaccharide export system protein LptA
MKKLFLLSVFTLVVASMNSLSAQKKEAELSITKSDRYWVNSNNNVSTLEGNVAISFGKLEVSNADKVTIDKEANKIVVVGYKEFAFRGKLIVVPNNDDKYTRLEYTIGDEVAYIK